MKKWLLRIGRMLFCKHEFRTIAIVKNPLYPVFRGRCGELIELQRCKKCGKLRSW